MAGRRPKPTKLKILNGNPGKRPLPGDEIDPGSGAPDMPSWLPHAAQDEWRRIVPRLLALGLLSDVHLGALVGYCEAFAEVKLCLETLAAGAFVETPSGLKTHPAARLKDAASKRMKGYLVEFGLTPAAQSKVHAEPAREKERHGKSRFFKDA